MFTIPTFEEAELAYDEHRATPLDIFVYHNEPGGPDDVQFRHQLQHLINYIEEKSKS